MMEKICGQELLEAGVSVLLENTWFTLREIDGLNSNTIGAIHSDPNGQVFLGGNNGLSISKSVKDPFNISI